MAEEQPKLGLEFRSKYAFIKSLQKISNMADQEAYVILWVLEMWDKKEEVNFDDFIKILNNE